MGRKSSRPDHSKGDDRRRLSFFFSMSELVSNHIYVSGKVQGVGYRDFTQQQASDLQLKGYARNLPDGRVEIEVEGEKAKVEAFIQLLRQGPPQSKVTSVDLSWGPPSSRFQAFSIRY